MSSKNYLITGGCGFIGSNYINHLYTITTGNIINIDLLTYAANVNNINNEVKLSERYKFLKLDLVKHDNISVLKELIKTYKIDIIIHFAAETHVSSSFIDPKRHLMTNIIGTYNLLESSKNTAIEQFIHISTDEVYGESDLKTKKSKTENSTLEPTNPYAASKAGAEMLSKSYFYSFKIPIKIVRCNNVYGLNQHVEKVIPKFISLLKSNKKLTIEGTGLVTRCFIHTQDVNNGINTIIEKGLFNNIYNIGNSEDEYTIKELGELLIKYVLNTNNTDAHINYIPDRLFNDSCYHIDYTKLKNLGWKPIKKLKDELVEIIKYS